MLYRTNKFLYLERVGDINSVVFRRFTNNINLNKNSKFKDADIDSDLKAYRVGLELFSLGSLLKKLYRSSIIYLIIKAQKPLLRILNRD